MFILDSLFISGLRWVMDTVATAADAEMNDDTVLREELMAAEMRREMGEISDEEFADIEADLLARIREIKERREGGSGPIAFGAPMETSEDTQFQIEATISGDFHEAPDASSGTVIEGTVLDSVPVEPRTSGTGSSGTSRTSRTSRTRTPRTPRTEGTTRTPRTSRTPGKIRQS